MARYKFVQDLVVREGEEKDMLPVDRFYVGIDFVFGDIFRNVRTRLWIKERLIELTEATQVDLEGAHFLYRSYLNELVIVQERLQRLIAWLHEGYGETEILNQAELSLLAFFNPVLFKKRNANHHSLYMGYPQSQEIERAVLCAKTAEERSNAVQFFRELMGRHLAFFEGTEVKFAEFMPAFLDRLHSPLNLGGAYSPPAKLPPDFKLDIRINGKLREKHNHAAVFKKANPGL